MDVNEIIKPENLVYDKPRLMNDNPMHYCPGCSHGLSYTRFSGFMISFTSIILSF